MIADDDHLNLKHMTISIKPIERTDWQQLAPLFQDYNYRHLWDFGKVCADRLGATSEHVGIYDDDQLLALADVRIKHIPFVKTGIAYINGGPLVLHRDIAGPILDNLQASLTSLIQHYVYKKNLVLRVSPPIGSPEWNASRETIFLKTGFTFSKSIKPYRTILLDLTQSMQDLRKQLDQKWRNNLKRAEKEEGFVESETSVSFLEHFEEIFKPVIEKKKFKVDLSPSLYRKVQYKLNSNDKLRVLLYRFNGEYIAGLVSSFLGHTAVNLFRANNEVALNLRAAYRLQWEVVGAAKKTGLKWYDLGGIDPEDNPGVYRFKKGMGGTDTTAPGPFEYYPNGLGRVLVSAAEKGYRAFQRK